MNPVPSQLDILYVSAPFVRGLETVNLKSTQQAMAFLLAVVIFHESVHFGRTMNNLPDDHSIYDYGWGFEEKSFHVVVRPDNITNAMIHYSFTLN